MKHRKASRLSIVVAVVMLMFLTMAFSASGSNDSLARQVCIPTQEEILKNGYPVNINGETFGPDVKDNLYTPDLVLAENDEGIVGYIRLEEIDGATISSPEEAATYSSHDQLINMYTEDGQTIIGKFFVGATH